MKGHIDEMKIFQAQKVEINGKIEKISQRMNDLDRQKGAKQKNLHRLYNTKNMVKKGIQDLERRLETTSLSTADEKRTIADIEKLKKSEPVFEEIDELNKQIQELKKDKSY